MHLNQSPKTLAFAPITSTGLSPPTSKASSTLSSPSLGIFGSLPRKTIRRTSTGAAPQQVLDRRRYRLVATLPSSHNLRKRCRPDTGALIRPLDPALLQLRPTSEEPGRLRHKSKSKSEGVSHDLSRYVIDKMCMDIKAKGIEMSDQEWSQLNRVKAKLRLLKDKLITSKKRFSFSCDWSADWKNAERLRQRRKRHEDKLLKAKLTENGAHNDKKQDSDPVKKTQVGEEVVPDTIKTAGRLEARLRGDINTQINTTLSTTYQFTFTYPPPRSLTTGILRDDKENINPVIFGGDRGETGHVKSATESASTKTFSSYLDLRRDSISPESQHCWQKKVDEWRRTPLV